MRNLGVIALFLLGFAALPVSSGRAFAAAENLGNWTESTAGRWESLPERHVGATDNGISVEVTMYPGRSVLYRHVGHWAAGSSAALRIAADNVNLGRKEYGRNDYLLDEAIFPASVTFVFGNDSMTIGWMRRVQLFLKQLARGFTPSGISLTYAWENGGIPVGSMYRLREEQTVFVVAGPEELGKTISTTRRLAEDFKAAYGRAPRGPVTEVRVSARRPSVEKGPVHASITVRFPAPPE